MPAITIQLTTDGDPRSQQFKVENPLTGEVLMSFLGAARQEPEKDSGGPKVEIVLITHSPQSGDIHILRSDATILYSGPPTALLKSMLQVNPHGYFKVILDPSAEAGVVILGEATEREYDEANSDDPHKRFREIAEILQEVLQGCIQEDWFHARHLEAMEDAIQSYLTISSEGIDLEVIRSTGIPVDVK